MPILNYQTPGVYVQQTNNAALVSVNSTALNICIVSSGTLPNATTTEKFQTTTSGAQTFTLAQSSAIGSSLAMTNNSTGATVASGSMGVTPTGSWTVSGTTLTTSGFSTNTWLNATYNYPSAAFNTVYQFSDFNTLQNTFGAPFTYISGTASVNSPISLASYLAFQNGAQLISCVLVSGGSADNFFSVISGAITNAGSAIDVLVPLCYDTQYNTAVTSSGLYPAISNWLNAQANNGIYQRAFLGLDSTVTAGGSVNTQGGLLNTVKNIAASIPNQRLALVAPDQITINPGLNSATGLATGTVNIAGYYLAAALAGTFVGQTDVYIPITRKQVNGFSSIPNQISTADSNSLQAYGSTVVRQERDGTMYVRHGLTTNTTNWLTQEISISAIGDRLADRVQSALEQSGIIGGVMTPNTLATLQTIVASVLIQAQTDNLIQSYQNLTYVVVPPTSVNVTFQYSPTYPLNYVNVNFSLNAQTGSLQYNVQTPTNTAV